jgi:Low-density lipoprotein receptor domain class A
VTAAKGHGSDPSVIVDDQDRPLVALGETASSGTSSARVARWNGQAWESLLAEPVERFVRPQLAAGPDGKPVVAIIDAQHVRILRLENDRWAEAPALSVKTGDVAMAADDVGRVLVAWSDGRKVLLSRLDGQSWGDLAGSGAGAGVSGMAGSSSDQPALAVRGTRVCVAWHQRPASGPASDSILLRCFDDSRAGCACDFSPACQSGCPCDGDCTRSPTKPMRCPDGQFYCGDGQCLDGTVVCNGKPDCSDGSDESPLCPGQPLLDKVRGNCGGFACADGSCTATRCDRHVQCADRSDEDASCDAATPWVREPIGLGASVHALEGLAVAESGVWGVSSLIPVRRTNGTWERVMPAVWKSYLFPYQVWAFGPSFAIFPAHADFLVWDGVDYRFVPHDPGDYFGLWGTSARDVWAVGTRLTDQTLGKRLGSSFLHFDGNAWTETAPAGMWIMDNFIRVAGSGPADVWAVGEKGVIAHWNGQSWQPSASGTTVNLTDVWADSAASAWAVGGSGTILHWTPSQGWKPEPPITSVGLRAIWGRGPGEVWAAGPAGTILRFDGSAWHHQWAGTGGSFYNLRGDADVIYAVGEETNAYRLPHK